MIAVRAVLLLCLCCLLRPPPCSGSEDEAAALLALKSGFDNRGDGVLPSWTNRSSPCGAKETWQGVFCMDGVVTALHLRDLNLSGTIDVDSLAKLHKLRSLSFARNSFSGYIPALSRLKGLKAIYLTGNHFGGRIPDDFFSNLTHLKKLWLAHNNFTGALPSSISSLLPLIDLHVEYNYFFGNIPKVNLPALKSFNVSYNLLAGTVPVGFRRFNVTAFKGNPALCGPPLVDKCGVGNLQPAQVALQPADVKSGEKAVVLMALITVVLVLVAGMAIMKKKSPRTGGGEESTRSGCGGAEYSGDKWQQQESTDAVYNGDQQGREQSSRGGERAESSVNGNHSTTSTAGAGELVMVCGERGALSMQDLMKAPAEVLGSGGLGSAYKAVLGNGAEVVVVKRMKEMNRMGKEEFDREMRRLGGLRHPNVLTPLAYHFRNDEKLLVFDYFDKGSLLYLLHGDRGPHHAALNWATRLRILKGIAKGMAYLHQALTDCGVPHGNLKSGNVLLRDDYQPMIIDYGYMSLTTHELATRVMFAYRSPESIRSGVVSPKSDVYCLGVVVLEILTGKFPSQYLPSGKGGTDLGQWVISALSDPNDAGVLDPDIAAGDAAAEEEDVVRLLHLGVALMEPNPLQRPDMQEAARRLEEAVEEPLARTEAVTDD